MPNAPEIDAAQRLRAAVERMDKEIRKVIVGQNAVVEEVLLCLLCKGHALLVGVPGLAKTLLIRTISRVLSLSFRRIQFTPDLMPSDITGTEILHEDPGTRQRTFKFLKGPVFAQILLADEINRTPPKTQAALLECMQEQRVTVGGTTHSLDEPFLVLATQNPIEQEGTYPLPEAQLDRFMFEIKVDYPERAEELEIMKRTTAAEPESPTAILGALEILQFQEIVRRVPVADHVFDYALEIVRRTRPAVPDTPSFVKDFVSWGAGPRASQYLILGAKARSLLRGRFHATTEDVKAVALPVLRHRILTNFNADSEGVTSDDIATRLLSMVPTPVEEAAAKG